MVDARELLCQSCKHISANIASSIADFQHFIEHVRGEIVSLKKLAFSQRCRNTVWIGISPFFGFPEVHFPTAIVVFATQGLISFTVGRQTAHLANAAR